MKETYLSVVWIREIQASLPETQAFNTSGIKKHMLGDVTVAKDICLACGYTDYLRSMVYIPIALIHLHGILEPLSRKMRTVFTESVPLHDCC